MIGLRRCKEANKSIWIKKRDGIYKAYSSFALAVLGSESPSLMAVYTQEALREAYLSRSMPKSFCIMGNLCMEAFMEKQITADTCVCCGAPVPEGRMVCWRCEHGYPPEGREERAT